MKNLKNNQNAFVFYFLIEIYSIYNIMLVFAEYFTKSYKNIYKILQNIYKILQNML